MGALVLPASQEDQRGNARGQRRHRPEGAAPADEGQRGFSGADAVTARARRT
jgi:hypothetical protein